MKIRIGILDSGVMKEHKELRNYNITGYSLMLNDDGNIDVGDDFSDDIGHGTAVYYLIQNTLKSSDVEVVNIKVFSADKLLVYDEFVKILEYIYNTENFDFINISSGIVQCGDISAMQSICTRFYERGCRIIAAYDNEGAVSFPAALNNVIGVDSSSKYNDMTFIEKGIVDVFCKSKFMRVAWNDGGMTLVKGNSFSCALVTAGLVMQHLKNAFPDTILRKNKYEYLTGKNTVLPAMKKTAVFPFNKEIHSIANNEDLLITEIVDYYSHKATGQVGKRICDLIKWSNNTKVIRNISNIDWDSFDSIIIGHTEELETLVGCHIKDELLNEAKNRGKVVYSFDPINNSKDHHLLFYPHISNEDVPDNYGKLYKTDKPILSIIGTSSSQGKYTLQLQLRRYLQKQGYKIGQIGTEPSALLFGMDCVFPCGYNSTVRLNLYNTLANINQMIYYMSQKDVNIIITGSQNAVITYNDNNITNYPIYHQVVLQAIQPDAMILCINPFDTFDYIKQSICAAESLTDGKVIAIVCFPCDIDDNWSVMQNAKTKIKQEKIEALKNIMVKQFNLDLFMLDDADDQEKLVESIISYFS